LTLVDDVLPDFVQFTLLQCGQRMLAAPRLYMSMVKQPPQTSSDIPGSLDGLAAVVKVLQPGRQTPVAPLRY
jgi:hypothetical protein